MSAVLPEELETRIRALRDQERLLEDELAALRNEPPSEPGPNHEPEHNDTATIHKPRRKQGVRAC